MYIKDTFWAMYMFTDVYSVYDLSYAERIVSGRVKNLTIQWMAD